MQSKLYMLSGSSLGFLEACRVSGHEPHQLPCLKYTWQSFSGPTFFMPPLLSEVMDLCNGVILCRVIWEIGPQTTFLHVAHLFTLLSTMDTCCGAQLNCTLHVLFCVATVWGLGVLISVMSSLREESSIYTSLNTLCLPAQGWTCRIYCINIYRMKVIIRKKLLRAVPCRGCLEPKKISH